MQVEKEEQPPTHREKRRKGKTIWTCDTTGSLNLNSTLCERVHGTPESPESFWLCPLNSCQKGAQLRCSYLFLSVIFLRKLKITYALRFFPCANLSSCCSRTNSCVIGARWRSSCLPQHSIQSSRASDRSTKATGSWFHEKLKRSYCTCCEVRGEWSILMYHSFTTPWRSAVFGRVSYCRADSLPFFWYI